MKHPIIITAICIVTVLSAQSCTCSCNCAKKLIGSNRVKAEGRDTTIIYDIPADYAKLDISSAFKATYSASAQRMEVTLDKGFVPYLDVHRNGDELDVNMNVHQYGDFQRPAIIIPVSISPLRKIELSGAVSFKSDTTIISPRIGIDVSGASKFSADILVDEIDVSISGASKAELGGSATAACLECSGASKIIGKGRFAVETAEISVSGASKITGIAAKSVSGSLSGASKLCINADAEVSRVETSGASKIIIENE